MQVLVTLAPEHYPRRSRLGSRLLRSQLDRNRRLLEVLPARGRRLTDNSVTRASQPGRGGFGRHNTDYLIVRRPGSVYDCSFLTRIEAGSSFNLSIGIWLVTRIDGTTTQRRRVDTIRFTDIRRPVSRCLKLEAGVGLMENNDVASTSAVMAEFPPRDGTAVIRKLWARLAEVRERLDRRAACHMVAMEQLGRRTTHGADAPIVVCQHAAAARGSLKR